MEYEKKYFKGRGAQVNPHNKFLKDVYVKEHDEGIDDWEESDRKTSFIFENSKSIVNKVDSPDVGMAYSNTGFWIFRPLDVPENEISVANLTGPGVRFYENGGIHDSRALLYEGFWAYEKVADMVPMDYIPLQKKQATSK